MRIALIGIGKMGSLIRKFALEQGHEIRAEIHSHNKHEIHQLSNDFVDVAIEFTSPSSATENFKALASNNIPTVTGTTGWYDRFDEVVSQYSEKGISFFYASNFSLGVHISIATSNYLAKLMNAFPEYSVKIEEWHHTEKKDKPSGTAITFAEKIIENYTRVNKYALDAADAPDAIPIKSYREGDIKGTHKVSYKSEIDVISLEHKALNRNGFALGALKAAEFIHSREPGIYTMKDLIHLEK
jgi:4-hydroxy-tetrahydrodipicolinate reductase